jgi:hypothetical protein
LAGTEAFFLTAGTGAFTTLAGTAALVLLAGTGAFSVFIGTGALFMALFSLALPSLESLNLITITAYCVINKAGSSRWIYRFILKPD